MRKNFLISSVVFFLSLLILHVSALSNDQISPQESQREIDKKATLLRLLNLIPSPESIDYVQEQTQYQLHALLTEQRHPKTWNLSDRIIQNMEAGLRMLFTVDEDIDAKLRSLGSDSQILERAVQAVEEAILSRRKIYLFGCQETGRWTKWVENSVWRSFWRNLQTKKKIWAKVRPEVGDLIEILSQCRAG